MFSSSVRKPVLAAFAVAFACAALAQDPSGPDGSPELRQRFNEMTGQLQDWAQLGFYRDANAAVPPPAPGERRVVFLGDSITHGMDLAKRFPGKPYLNRGIPGQTTPQMLVRFRPDVLAHSPEVVVILAGTNDIGGNTGPATLESIQDNLASMAELAAAHGVRVVFASLLPVHDRHPHRPVSVSRPPETIRRLNRWLKAYCEKKGHVYLDYHSRMADAQGFLKEELSDDGLHPTPEGYDVMTPLAEAAIERALRRPK
jgi:lysophospholipase L1-like esterase